MPVALKLFTLEERVAWTITSLLMEEPGGWCTPFSRGSIDIDHEKKVDLGVLRGADHDGRD